MEGINCTTSWLEVVRRGSLSHLPSRLLYDHQMEALREYETVPEFSQLYCARGLKMFIFYDEAMTRRQPNMAVLTRKTYRAALYLCSGNRNAPFVYIFVS